MIMAEECGPNRKEIVIGARIILVQDRVIAVYITKSTIIFTLSDKGKP